MGEVLVLVDEVDGTVKKSTTELLTAARRLGSPAAVWVGPGISDAAIATLGEFGAAKVYVAGDADVAKHPVAPAAEVLAQLVTQTSPVLWSLTWTLSSDSYGRPLRSAGRWGMADMAEGEWGYRSITGGG